MQNDLSSNPADLNAGAKVKVPLEEYERKLVEENARFRALTEHSSDAVSLVSLDGTVLYGSPSTRHVLGYEPDEFVGRSGFELIHPDDHARVRSRLAELARTPATTVTEEMRVRHKDGSWRWVECVGTNLVAEPAVRAVVVNFRDISERRRAVEALRESEDRFARFMQHLPGLAWIKDVQGRYVFANDSAVKAFGKPRAELYGKTDAEVFPPETAEQFRANDRRALAGGAGVQVVETLAQRDGVLHHSLVSKFPIPGADGKPALVGGMAIDITEQMRTRAILEESELRFRQLAENINEVFWMSDLDKAQLLYVSPAYEQVWGRSCRSLYEQPRSFLDAIHPDDRERVAVQALARQARGETSDVEYRVLRPDGSVRWVRDRGFPIKDASGPVRLIAGIAEDVTDARNAAEALRAGEERFRLLTEVVPQLVWSSLPNGAVDYCNPRWLNYTGFTREQVRGDGWAEALHPDDRAATLAAWGRAIATGQEYQVEHRLRARDGQYRWFLTRALPLRDGDGNVVGWYGTCTDIEDRRRMEEALREADRRKNEFLAMLAHELRNPLAPVRNAVHLLRSVDAGGVAAEQAREMIERQVQNMVRLVDDLLDVSRITRGKIQLRIEPVDLATVVARAVESARPLIDANRHTLSVSLPPGPVRLLADPTRLEQVFANLLNNAAKYTERGGSIWLAAEVEEDAEMERRGEGGMAQKTVIGTADPVAAGPCPRVATSFAVAVRVRDTGFGIPRQLLPHVFDLFTQADRTLDRAQGGLGIGLTLVKLLVEMHGGGVTAHSDGPGQGSEFIVRLPVLRETAEPLLGEGPRLPSAGGAAGFRVLVVDDNKDAADSLALLLRLWGHEVRIAHDGLSGLKAARSYAPEIVLLDIGLPGMDGYDVARTLRAEFGPGMRLIAMTGYGQDDDRRRSREAGFDRHLVKPVDPDVLQEIVVGLATPNANSS